MPANAVTVTANFEQIPDPGTVINVSTTQDWETALTAIKNGDDNQSYTIFVNGDIGISGYTDEKGGAIILTFGGYSDPENAKPLTVTLKGNGRIYLTSLGALINMGANQTVIIDSENLTLQGMNNNTNHALIKVWSGSTFELRNGTISGNTNNSNTTNRIGGGVRVDNGGTFTMSGGTISGNTGTGGGGVRVNSGGTFTMNDGTISGNTGTGGGGVWVNSGGTFTMNDGAISDNNATNGGGVYVWEATFIMSGGTISGNTADSYGGGVCDYGTFIMTGGTISGNTATVSGGGVDIYEGTFRIVNGTIYGNSESITNLRNNADDGAALGVEDSTAQRGTFSIPGDITSTWTSKGDLTTTNDTIKVANGEIVQ